MSKIYNANIRCKKCGEIIQEKGIPLTTIYIHYGSGIITYPDHKCPKCKDGEIPMFELLSYEEGE